MSVHRATVPPSFEPGAAPDTQQHSQYASLARPLLVAASHSLQNDSQPCYDPLLAVCSSGPGNISWGVVDIETLLFASYEAALQLDPSRPAPPPTQMLRDNALLDSSDLGRHCGCISQLESETLQFATFQAKLSEFVI
ncbi:hypothetical protein C8F01DRAFT_1369345 [Mycena amicta]|nr:hypothetical protein C8F01DRAFT_1369345 [Mycena amicta]